MASHENPRISKPDYLLIMPPKVIKRFIDNGIDILAETDGYYPIQIVISRYLDTGTGTYILEQIPVYWNRYLDTGTDT